MVHGLVFSRGPAGKSVLSGTSDYNLISLISDVGKYPVAVLDLSSTYTSQTAVPPHRDHSAGTPHTKDQKATLSPTNCILKHPDPMQFQESGSLLDASPAVASARSDADHTHRMSALLSDSGSILASPRRISCVYRGMSSSPSATVEEHVSPFSV